MAKAFKRNGSPYWCGEFKINGVRKQVTSDLLSTTSQKEGDLAVTKMQIEMLAKAKEIQRIEDGPLTIAYAFNRYREEVGNNRADAKDIAKDHERILDMIRDLPKSKQPIYLEDFDDNHMALIVTKRRAQQVDRHRGPNGSYKPIPTDPAVSVATVNRSCVERMQAVFERARNIWKKGDRFPFPKEPTWSEHLLSEGKRLPRPLKVAEHLALTEVFDANYEILYRFAILSGFRMGEIVPAIENGEYVRGLRKENVDFAMGKATVQVKGGNLVSKQITPEMESIIRECWNDHPIYVFTYKAQRTHHINETVKGERYPITYQGLKTCWRRRRKEAAEIAPSLISNDRRQTMRFHGLRGTFGTNTQKQGGDLTMTRDAMGHGDASVTQVYVEVAGSQLLDVLTHAENNHYLPGMIKNKKAAAE